MATLPSIEELNELPLRAIIAYAALCATRVLSVGLPPSVLGIGPDDLDDAAETAQGIACCREQLDFEQAERVYALSRSIKAATEEILEKRFSSHVIDAAYHTGLAAYYAVYAAACAFDRDRNFIPIYASEAARAAANAALHNFGAAGESGMIGFLRRDYDSLKNWAEQEKRSDRTPVPVDLFATIWPEGLPTWVLGRPPSDKMLPSSELESLEFDVWLDPGSASAQDIQSVFQALSDLNRAHGGPGLIFATEPSKAVILKGA